jgi:cephalosporin hydroxylase
MKVSPGSDSVLSGTLPAADAFANEVSRRLDENAQNESLTAAARMFMVESTRPKYSYNFSWLGRPIIQYPQDMLAMQEILWTVKPDLVIETGIAHGGSLVFYASLLTLNAACGGPADAVVLGIDIDIRSHNRRAIEQHPMFERIHLIEGSSTAPDVADQARRRAQSAARVVVCLDSNHTHEHVLAELELYARLTTPGSYCVVFDTIIEDLPPNMYPDRPWSTGNNPKTAVKEYLAAHPEFEIDYQIDSKLLISVSPNGYLKRVR